MMSGLIDVLILGGGAGGVAVVLQLVEQVKSGKCVKTVTVVEQNDVLGPGLAFSEACDGTILNMHSDTMGIYHDNLKDYTNWRESLEDGPFPSRVNYGHYLQSRWNRAVGEAASLGLKISVVHSKAHDIDRLADGIFSVTLQDKGSLIAKSVVMALGNFTGSANAHLADKAGYFHNPWPTSQLKSIPSDAHVLVVGSRLSAVDAAIYLSANNHTGPITFMSRSGKLPKVQGEPVPFTRKYVLHELARKAESMDSDGLLQIASVLMDEISLATNGDWTWMLENESHLDQLKSDILAAQNKQVRWQSVLNSTAPVIERYWNSLSSSSQALFMQRFNSTWMTYRHAMPVKNAQKICNLLVKGQLQVLKGDTITWNDTNSMFSAKTSAGVLEVAHVVEATGQECHVDRIDVPIVKSAVAKGMLQAHPVGGVQVDFQTLEASPGLYVMGSLTRGKHFYVSATDRVAAHSARIARALTQDPFTKSFHVGLFVGSDLLSHLIAGQLVPQLLAAGHMPYVFVNVESKSDLSEIRNLDFIELLQEHVIANLQNTASSSNISTTVRQMRAKYGILVKEIRDINSQSFIRSLETHHIDVGVSVQFGQQFEAEFTKHFVDANGTLLMLDTGAMAADRAQPTLMQAMKNKQRDFGYTLHQVIGGERFMRSIDAQKQPIDYSKSMLHCANDLCRLGVDMTAAAVSKLARGEELGAMLPPTPPTDNADFSDILAAKSKLDEDSGSEYPLADAAGVVQILVDSFGTSKQKDAFQTHILGVVKDWLDKNHVQAEI